MKIGYQGIPGSYSETALAVHLPHHEYIPCTTFTELIRAGENCSVDAILLPIENTTGGSIKRAYSLMIESSLLIYGEVNFPVHHCLLAHPSAKRNKIKRVISHPEALLQCRKYIEKNNWISIEYRDTAESAQLVSRKKYHTIAVIASNRCAELYNLHILECNIEDASCNTTRFLLLSRTVTNNNPNKITITFRLPHAIGSLTSILQIIAEHNFNLTKIESCPIPDEPYHYEFVLDIEIYQKNWQQLIDTLKNNVLMLKLLGTY